MARQNAAACKRKGERRGRKASTDSLGGKRKEEKPDTGHHFKGPDHDSRKTKLGRGSEAKKENLTRKKKPS